MMRIACSGLIALFALCFSSAYAEDAAPQWSLAIHGGAGVIERASLTPEQDAAYRAALQGALDAGSAVLKSGGSALDAVQAAVQVMEDDPLFNAGRGAVFTAAGRNKLDAAVMNGSDLTAGSVAGLTTTRHPVAAARAVMERSPHVMLIGPGADAFAASVGLEQVDPAFFFTERRWQGLVKALTEAGQPIPERPAGAPLPGAQAEVAPPLNEKKFGTVGAVALDSQGRLAAATSTGGMTAKRWGRVGTCRSSAPEPTPQTPTAARCPPPATANISSAPPSPATSARGLREARRRRPPVRRRSLTPIVWAARAASSSWAWMAALPSPCPPRACIAARPPRPTPPASPSTPTNPKRPLRPIRRIRLSFFPDRDPCLHPMTN